jgi:UDPglucose 6-dehydrogenase
MREAPSRVLMEALWAAGASVRAYDPAALAEAQRIYGNRRDLVLCRHAEDTWNGADALAIVTEWREFRSPDFAKLKVTLRHPVIFDGRNLYDPSTLRQQGIRYFAIGRGETVAVR